MKTYTKDQVAEIEQAYQDVIRQEKRSTAIAWFLIGSVMGPVIWEILRGVYW